jgi:hypothetical protein
MQRYNFFRKYANVFAIIFHKMRKKFKENKQRNEDTGHNKEYHQPTAKHRTDGIFKQKQRGKEVESVQWLMYAAALTYAENTPHLSAKRPFRVQMGEKRGVLRWFSRAPPPLNYRLNEPTFPLDFFYFFLQIAL